MSLSLMINSAYEHLQQVRALVMKLKQTLMAAPLIHIQALTNSFICLFFGRPLAEQKRPHRSGKLLLVHRYFHRLMPSNAAA